MSAYPSFYPVILLSIYKLNIVIFVSPSLLGSPEHGVDRGRRWAAYRAPWRRGWSDPGRRYTPRHCLCAYITHHAGNQLVSVQK